MAKSTAAVKGIRVGQILDLLIRGASRGDIMQHAAKHQWGIRTRQIDSYIAAARAELRTYENVDRSEQLGVARKRLELLFAASIRDKDFKTALSVQREINLLESLYAPPAARTLKLIGLDANELAELAQLLEDEGLVPKEVFQKMRARLQENKNKRKADTDTVKDAA